MDSTFTLIDDHLKNILIWWLIILDEKKESKSIIQIKPRNANDIFTIKILIMLLYILIVRYFEDSDLISIWHPSLS